MNSVFISPTSPDGIYHDQWLRAHAPQQDFGWRHNIVVDRCRILLAAFMRGDTALGIQSLAVGKGDSSWDSTPPPPAAPGLQQLVDAAAITLPVSASDISYLDATGGVSSSATARIQIRLTLDTSLLPPVAPATTYPLREFGLLGRYGSNDYLIDYVRHPVIHLGAGDSLVRTIRLVF